MKIKIGFSSYAAALLLSAWSLITPAHADTLIDRLDGMTLDAQGQVERFTGLLIGNDGRIIQLIHRGDKRPARIDYLVDGKGRNAIPGIIDAHAHVLDIGFAELARKQNGPPPSPLAKPRPEDRDLALAIAQKLLLEHGITSITDMGTTIEDWQTFRRAGDLGTLNMRIISYARGPESMVLIGGPGPTPWLYDDHLRLNGMFLSLDDALSNHGALLGTPYADNAKNTGHSWLSEIQLKNLMSRASIDRFQVAIEAHGDAAAAQVLNAIGELSQTYTGERRWRIVGTDVVAPGDLPRFAALGVGLSQSPVMQMAGQTLAETALGAGRIGMAYRWKSLADAGAKLSFGMDNSSAVPNPFAVLATAMTRTNASSQPYGGWQPQERLRFEQAFAALTTGPAYAAFAETRIGRLAPGLRADFLIIDSDLQLAAPSQLRSVKVLQSWVGGRMVYASTPQ